MIHALGKFVIGLFLATLFILGAILPASAKQKSAYTIAVLPSAPPVALHTLWAPVLEQLSAGTGLRFRLKLFERMADFEREIGEGTADFIFASPIQTVVAHKMHSYLPLVRGGKQVSIGLFVRRDSHIRTIDDLSGNTISFVGNKNVCSVFVQHLLLKQNEPLKFSSEYSGSTRNVIKNVLLGKSAAGAVFIPELEKEPVANRELLRSVLETPKMSPHPLSAHPRVPPQVRGVVKKVMLEMASTSNGVELFKTIRLPDPVAADYARDYAALEVVDIKGLTDWGK